MALINPPGMSQINNILGLAGGDAQGLMNLHDPGVKKVRATMGQIGKDPNIALPGGGTFFGGSEGSPLQQVTAEETPAATLPVYQNEVNRMLGLSGVESGASTLGSEKTNLQTQYSQGIQQLLASLGSNFGLNKLQAGGIGGGYGVINSLLNL